MSGFTNDANNTAQDCMLCHVSGQVQGVWYRGSTQEQAFDLNITGYARNLTDGRVEVLACGAHNALSQLEKWLQKGPAHARVSDVSCVPCSQKPVPATFTTA